MTTAEAARLCGVRPATIRQWASGGYLTAVGLRGRSPLYDSEQLAGAQTGVQDRTRTGPPIRPTVALRSKDLDALLYGADSAALVGVAPSTIRMWKMRGACARSTGPVARCSESRTSCKRPAASDDPKRPPDCSRPVCPSTRIAMVGSWLVRRRPVRAGSSARSGQAPAWTRARPAAT